MADADWDFCHIEELCETGAAILAGLPCACPCTECISCRKED
jgi:hypothetical protein